MSFWIALCAGSHLLFVPLLSRIHCVYMEDVRIIDQDKTRSSLARVHGKTFNKSPSRSFSPRPTPFHLVACMWPGVSGYVFLYIRHRLMIEAAKSLWLTTLSVHAPQHKTVGLQLPPLHFSPARLVPQKCQTERNEKQPIRVPEPRFITSV